MDDISALGAIVEELGPRFSELSDAIWDNPQLRWEEFDAVDRQSALAEELGFTVERNVGEIPTAFWAEKGSGGPLIAFLGEHDALASLSQASGVAERLPNPETENTSGAGCGHHLLGAGSLLATVAAATWLERNGLPGRVRYYGCPAEEAAAGKSFMVQRGAFEGVDGAVSWHPMGAMSTRQQLTLA